MPPVHTILWLLLFVMTIASGVVLWAARRRNMDRWLWSFVRQSVARGVWGDAGASEGPIDVILCIADHFEPSWGNADAATADARVEAWLREYPAKLGAFKDSDGRPPRHTFFYPIDQYEPRHVDSIAALCRDGYGEVEIHLHHDSDTAENLASTLATFTDLFSKRHGLLGRWPDGRPAFGFVHGNWALDNSRPDRKWCGVDNEIEVLRRAGCYADFTLPSAPDASQTSTINSIYYAIGRPGKCKSHDRGVECGSGAPPTNGLMMIQGPLRLFRSKGSLRPRIENACVQASQPASMERLDQWIRAAVRVRRRPEWVFVKLHTHGAKDANREVLLGEAGVSFHRALAQRAAANPNFRYHYVTAREMYNLAKAAESGWSGSVIGGIGFVVADPDRHNPPERAKGPE